MSEPPEGVTPTRVPNEWETRDEASRAKNTFGPVRALASDRAQKHVWAGVAIFSLVVSTLSPIFIINHFQQQMNERPYVFVLDAASTIHAGPMERLSLSSEIFSTTALHATQAALQRSPVGLDLPEIAKGMFTESALKKLEKDVEAQMPDIQARSLHQKPEISAVTALNEKAGFRTLEVKGQILRSGKIGGTALAEPSLPFQLLLLIKQNPKMSERGQYPFVVSDYKFRQIGAATPTPPAPKK
jgi:hypothetical protein